VIGLWVALACHDASPDGWDAGSVQIDLSGVDLGFDPAIANYVVRASSLDTLTTVRTSSDRRGDRFVLRLKTSTGDLIEDDVARTLALQEDTRLEIDRVRGDAVSTWTVSVVPDGLPLFTASGIDSGLSFFVTPRDYRTAYPPSGYRNYLLVVDGRGIPTWWRRTTGVAYDFRPAADGRFTALAQLDDAEVLEAVLLEPVGGQTMARWLPVTPPTWENVETDPHELRLAADGAWLQSIAGTGTMDLTTIGGDALGEVRHSGLVEHDSSGEVIAMWSSQGVVDLAALPSQVLEAEAAGGAWRYAHVNSVDLLDDGWLVSLRSPGEVLRIRRDDGAVVWTLGGTRSDFAFVGDPRGGFFGQHSARWLSPDRVLLFDNATNMGSEPTGDARVVEYVLDTTASTAELVFEYALDGVGGAEYGGSVQRLSDGRTVVGFGSIQRRGDGSRAPSVGVFDSEGQLVSELALPEGMYTYRAWAQGGAGEESGGR